MSDVSVVQETPRVPRPQYRPRSKWTPERIERLKVMAADNRSCGEIAADLGNGISRNAVIGKLSRLGLSTGNTKGTRGADRRPRRIARKARLDEIFEHTEVTDLPSEQSDCAITFRQAKAGDGKCRYPIGDPRDVKSFRFCGAPQAEECGSYCARHFRFTHRRTNEISEEERQRRSMLGRRMAARNNNKAAAWA